ncbi:MAG: hypothetical protein ABW072_12470 [Sedimenticola sp.]
MEIFISRLPDRVNRIDLIRFIAPAVHQPQMFSEPPKRAHIDNCEIIQITNLETHEVEFHGLAKIEPAWAAEAAIEYLNGTELKGKNMEVRMFSRRSPFKDRRRGEASPINTGEANQRKSDRRRNNLRVEILHAGTAQYIVSDDQPIN